MHDADKSVDWNAVIHRDPPEHIYTYWKDDQYLEENLSKCQCYLSSPLSFNDPFDCQLHVSFSGSEQEARTKTKEILSILPSLKFARPDKKRKVFGPAVESAQHGRLYKAEVLEERIKKSCGRNGIVCFSEDPKSILMWAHYASKHEGVCVKFDTSFSSWINQARQVQYVSRYPELSFLSECGTELFTRLILSKATEWKYEKEWRFFWADPPPNRLKSFPPKALVAVIFGARMKPSRKAVLSELIHRLHPHVELLEAQTDKGEFKLEFQPYKFECTSKL